MFCLNKFNDRLSYQQSDEERDHHHEFSAVFNPCKSLTDVFNSICEEEAESENLNVFLRIRPTFAEESISAQDGNLEILNPRSILLTAPSNSHVFRNKPQGTTKVSHRFTFTQVYNHDTSQKQLFEETTQGLVKDLVSGQNCLLFTYGATNSGKTYTIQGTPSNSGLLPRTLDVLFKSVGNHSYNGNDLHPQLFCGVVRMTEKEARKEEEMKEELLKVSLDSAALSFSRSSVSFDSHLSQDSNILSPSSSISNTTSTSLTEHSVKDEGNGDVPGDGSVDSAYYAIFVSFAEIYNEYIYDLLDKQAIFKKNKRNPLAFGEDKHGAIYVKGLREVRVKSTEEAIQVLEVGKQSLHFAATRLNHHSSRSHCIFTIKLLRLADPLYPHVARVSMLSLCDLAGAERAGKTLNSLDRLKEASNINTSLLVLGRCMSALRQNQIISKQPVGFKKQIPVPYRDSKVTRLFQSFFMGKGKVAMIVNISTASILYDETLKVLKFSALANKVTITQEKQPLEQPVHGKKFSNQFSRLMRHSLNVSTSSASGRLSVPWSNKSFADVTFGGTEELESSRMVTLHEEQECEEEDEKYTALMQLIDKLKQKLLKESKDKMELESKLRKEICDAFSHRMVQIENTWKNRLKEEQAISDEYNEWRINHVLNSVKKPDGCRKRLRTENDSFDETEELVPSILLAREEIKVQNLEGESIHMQEEIAAVKSSLKASNQASKTAQEENSKLVFQLADLTGHIDKVQKEKEELKTSIKQYQTLCAQNQSSDNLEVVVRELHNQIETLQSSDAFKEQELKNVKDLLIEAAEEFREKELIIKNLRGHLTAIKTESNNQSILICDLENQLSEAKEMYSCQRCYFEEREQVIHELQAELEALKDESPCNVKSKDSVKVEESVKEKESKISQVTKEMNSVHKELSDLKNERSCMQPKNETNKLTPDSISSSFMFKQLDVEKAKLEDELTLLTSENLTLKSIVKQFASEIEDLKCRTTLTSQNQESASDECKILELKMPKVLKQCQDMRLELENYQQNNDLEVEAEKRKYTEMLEIAEKKIDEMYKEKEATNGRLRTLIESNGKLEIRMKAALQEKETLEVTVSELESQLNLTSGENEMLTLKVCDLCSQLKEANEVKEKLGSKMADLEIQEKAVFGEKNNLLVNVTDLEMQIKSLNEVKEMHEAKVSDLEILIKESVREKESLATKASDLELNIKVLVVENEVLAKKTLDMETQTMELIKEKEILEIKAIRFESQTKSAILEKDSLQANILKLQSQISVYTDGEARESRESLLEEVMRLVSVIDAKDEALLNLSNIVEDYKKFKQQSEDLQEVVVLKEMTIKELWKDLESLREFNDKQVHEFNQLKNELESNAINEKCLVEENSNVTTKYDEASNTIENLKSEVVDINLKFLDANKKNKMITTELEEKMHLIEMENRDFKNKVEELQAKLSELNTISKLTEKEEEISNLIKQKESLINKIEIISQTNDKNLQSDETIKKLTFTLEDLEAMNSKIETQLHETEVVNVKLEKEVETLQRFKDENIKLKELLAISCKKEKDLEELHFKSKTEIHNMSYVLEGKDETVVKMAAKIESLDKKINLTEEELQPCKTKCEILEKEVAALREARNEESNQLRSEIEEKDSCLASKEEEIISLQQEIKKLIRTSASTNLTNNEGTETKVKKEVILKESSALQDKLSTSEGEISMLKLKLSSLQHELDILKEASRFHDESKTTELSITSRNKSPCKNIKTTDVDSCLNETPPRSSRSSRVRRTKKTFPLITLENATPDSLQLNASDCDDLNSAIKAQHSRRGRGRNVKSKYSINESLEDHYFKIPSYSVKSCNSKPISLAKCSASEDEDLWQPPVSIAKAKSFRTSKSSKSKSKRSNVKIYNPHLDKENKSRERSSSQDQDNDVEKSASPTFKPTRGRSRRQRPLYNINANDEPFECAPNLIQLNNDEDSPHTTVRRMLRSKTKPK